MAIGASRIFHVNVNCSNLERSLRFYQDVIGLTPSTHTAPAPQPGTAFGLETAQWDAWIMTGENGYDGVVLDLLEWQVPRPTGTPPPTANVLGFNRLGFITPDLDALHARLVDAGADCFGPPHTIEMEGVPPIRAFVFKDPDGTLIEAVSGDANRLAFVSVNCSDLDASTAFYRDVVGLQPLARFTPGPTDGAALRIDGTMELEMAYLSSGTTGPGFAIDLQEWKQPRPTGAAAASANQLGIYRMAFLTDDIDADYKALTAAGVECVTPPADLDMGPGLPQLRALLFPDPDGTMLELIESPTP
jgi:catechol 2,3-dioxygenase-like lactoylglutathione lyase family enzyme